MRAFLGTGGRPVLVSDLAAVELASAFSRLVRMRDMSRAEARRSFEAFDAWRVDTSRRIQLSTADIATSEQYLRRLDLTLRTVDAMHIAIAWRMDAELATFDRHMADSARKLGVAVATI